jgi:UBX domain-containing protein 6
MSFFKDLFDKDKRKDAKYGKGHKLGSSQENSSSASTSRQADHHEPPQQHFQSEASKRAAEAALARSQAPKSANAHSKSALTSKLNQVQLEESSLQRESTTELDKALKLKDHYFNNAKQQVVDNSQNKIFFKYDGLLKKNERYEKNEIEHHIEMALLDRLDEGDEDAQILVVVSLFLTANNKNQEKLKKCIELLNKFIENILKSPSEEKFRKIRIENPTIKEKVMSCKFVDTILTKSGFIKRSELNKDTNLQEDYFVYESDELHKLERLKTILDISEPVVPQLDRDIKIFKSSENTILPETDLSSDFYNATFEEIKQQQRQRTEALEIQGIIRTKQMRERDEQSQLRLYNYCLIRVRFPDNFILQATFKSSEKFSQLHELVQECLEYKSSFEFFGHSLKKTSTSDYMNMTLAEAGLAPSSLVNFRYTDGEDQNLFSNKLYLKSELLQNLLIN